MDPAPRLAGGRAEDVDERGDVVVGDRLALLDGLHREGGGADGLEVGLGRALHLLAGGHLDPAPRLHARLVGPQGADLGAGVAVDHSLDHMWGLGSAGVRSGPVPAARGPRPGGRRGGDGGDRRHGRGVGRGLAAGLRHRRLPRERRGRHRARGGGDRRAQALRALDGPAARLARRPDARGHARVARGRPAPYLLADTPGGLDGARAIWPTRASTTSSTASRRASRPRRGATTRCCATAPGRSASTRSCAASAATTGGCAGTAVVGKPAVPGAVLGMLALGDVDLFRGCSRSAVRPAGPRRSSSPTSRARRPLSRRLPTPARYFALLTAAHVPHRRKMRRRVRAASSASTSATASTAFFLTGDGSRTRPGAARACIAAAREHPDRDHQ